jgi:APA family basic amino acid/polyamine antiporter
MAVLSTSKQLKKEITLFGVYTLATGATLSSGFFLLPGLAAVEAGPAVVLAYLVAVIPMFPGILSKIELATAMPRAGGEYYFMDRSLGPLMGTIGGFGTWIALSLKASFALIGIGAYLQLLAPGAPVLPVAAGIAVMFGVVNLFGAQKSSAIQVVLVIGLLGLLGWFVLTGLPKVQPKQFTGFFDKGSGGILVAAGMVCVSYMGLTNVASVAEEVKDPERNLTLGILLALATAVVVYLVGTAVIVGLVKPEILYAGAEPSLTPVAEAAKAIAGRWGVIIMSVAAILAFLSVGNSSILSASRYPLAMSRDHLLPPALRRLNRFQTPHVGVIVTVILILVLVLALDPTKIAKLASSFLLLLFASNCLAVVVMRESRIESYDPGFKAPFYPWLQIVGIIGPLGLIIVMGWFPMLFTAGLVTIGAIWYVYYAKKRVNRGGAIYHLFARLGQRQYAGLDRELRGILKEKGLRANDPFDEVVASAAIVDEPGDVTYEQLVHKASEHLAVHLPVSSEVLSRTFLEGSRVGATPVDKGAALPHIRLPGLSRPLMVLARAPKGVHVVVDSDLVQHAKDQAIYAVFFLVSPEEDAAQHLRILAQVAQSVDEETFMENWAKVDHAHGLNEMLMRKDRYFHLYILEQGATREFIDLRVDQLSLSEGAILASILRGGQPIHVDADVRLQLADRLVIVGDPESIKKLKEQYVPKD